MDKSLRTILGLIPARAGSKGVPGKNSRPLVGKPLIQYAIAAAIESGVVDRLIVSTDSQDIAELAVSLGAEAPFLRPDSLAQDDTSMLPVAQHAVTALGDQGWRPDLVMLLQPTSPLRKPEHLRAAVELLDRTGADSVVSVVEVPAHYSPGFLLHLQGDRLWFAQDTAAKITRRQDLDAAYSRNGIVYLVKTDVLMRQDSFYGRDCRALVLPRSVSVNIDDPEDWEEAEWRLSRLERGGGGADG